LCTSKASATGFTRIRAHAEYAPQLSMGNFSKIIYPDINRYLPRIPGKMKNVGNMPSNYTTKIAAAL
jgi:hypothetical protein